MVHSNLFMQFYECVIIINLLRREQVFMFLQKPCFYKAGFYKAMVFMTAYLS